MTNKFTPFYNDQGGFAPSKMFREYQHSHTTNERKNWPSPIYTLKPNNIDGCVSAYAIYMEASDEYEAGITLCPTFEEWDRLSKMKWFESNIKTWREHMRLRDASLAKKKLIAQTKEGNVAAAKTLLAETKPKSSAGRRTKKQEPEKAKLAVVKDFQKKREARNG